MTHAAQFINGQWLTGEGAEFSSLNPAKGDVIWTASAATSEQVDTAVKAAREAYYTWTDLAFEQRLAVVKKFSELLTENKEELAKAIGDGGLAGCSSWSVNRFQPEYNSAIMRSGAASSSIVIQFALMLSPA